MRDAEIAADAQNAVERRLARQGLTPNEIDPEEWRELVREEEEKIQEEEDRRWS